MGNPNQHAASPLPLVAVGGGAGKGNRHLLNKRGNAGRQPVAELWPISSAVRSKASA